MRQFLYLILSTWILVSACNDPILVGSVLLEDEALNVEFTDGLDIEAKTILGDSSITFRRIAGSSFTASTYMVGNLKDPVFGRSEAVTYFSASLLTSYPSFSEYPPDSIVLSIPFDSLGFYGDPDAVHDLELRALSESLESLAPEATDTLYSDQIVGVEPTIISTRSTRVSFTDSITIRAYNEGDPLFNIRPELRMELDKQFWIDLAGSLTDTLTVDEFESQVLGFELKSSSESNSFFGLDLFYASFNSEANINFYYTIETDEDTVRNIYQLPLGEYRHSLFTNDYAGSELEANMNDPASNLYYIQSQAGTSVEIDLSSAKDIGEKILNFAELKFTVQTEDEELYEPIQAVFPWYENDEGQLQIVGSSSTDPPLVESYSGGSRTLSYSLDLTSHVNAIKKGEISNDKIILIPNSKAQRAHRSIILGPNDPDHPMKLNLILTKP